MQGSDHIAIEVRFVPLPDTERDERSRRLRLLLLRGALRVVEQDKDRQTEGLEPELAVCLDTQRK